MGIRKFNGPDGRTAWALTHIDAVMDDNGTLRKRLESLVPESELSPVAKSGSYSDLTGKPTKLSQFTNDKPYVDTEHLKTINGISLYGTDNIQISGDGDAVWGSEPIDIVED